MTEEERAEILIKSIDTIIEETIEDFFSDFELVEELKQIQTSNTSSKEAEKNQKRIKKLRDEIIFEIQQNRKTANRIRKRESCEDLPTFKGLEFKDAKVILKQFNDFRIIERYDDATKENSPLYRFNEEKQIFEEASSYIETLSQWLTGKVKTKGGEHPVETMLRNEIFETTKQFKDPDFIPCKNGLFNVKHFEKTGELIPYSKNRVVINPFETNFNPNATNPAFEMEDGNIFNVEEDFFKPLVTTESGIFKPALYELFWDMLSLIVYPWRRYNRAFMLYSEKGANGKGTFKDLVKYLVGPSLSRTINMKQFKDDPKLLPLVDARLALADENEVNEYLKDNENFKACVTGDSVIVNVKYKDALEFSFDGKIIQCMNSLPSSSDKSRTLSRRFLLIPFLNCFLHKENKNIKGDYIKDERVREYILRKAALRNVKDIPEEKWPQEVKELLKMYELENDSLLAWWDDFEPEFKAETQRKDEKGEFDSWDGHPFHELHDIFLEWCRKGGTGNGESGLKFQRFKKEFINKILPKISSEWSLPPNDKQIFSTTKAMKEKPNRLLLQYKCDSIYNGYISDLEKVKLSKADFERGIRGGVLKESYQGIIRNK